MTLLMPTLLLLNTSHAQPPTIPAFPSAEGFGAYATGGRGGDVYHVTNLDDAGTGSLREGIDSASGPRTIVFDVSGTIVLQSRLRIRNPNITIAGQTAPGDGICLRDYSLDIKNTHDIVIRYLRLRRGDVQVRATGTRPTSSAGLDVMSIDDSQDIVIDHCSLSWSCDEIFGIVQNKNVTVQWCIISEPLGDPPLHPYGDRHAYGLNNSANTLSVHHCLVSNYVMRGPQFEANDAVSDQGYDVYMESVNNVLFDYKSSGSRYTTGIEDYPERAVGIDFRFHFLNSTYIRGPNSAPEIQATPKHGVTDQLRVYVKGNIGPNRVRNDLDEWRLVFVEKGPNILLADSAIKAQMSDEPLFVPPVPITVQGAEAAYEAVLLQAGCSIVRDVVDKRVVGAVIDRRFRDYLRSQDQVGGWPELSSAPAPVDTDRDGMPDSWEQAHGLDSADPTDGNGIGGNGYTNLEEYLIDLTDVERTPPTGTRQEETPDTQGIRLQHRPNPMNYTTSIRFSLPDSRHVRLGVYDLNGHLIETLADAHMSSGWHEVAWDSRDALDRPVGGGVYFCRLTAEQTSLVRRMVLVR